MIRLAILAIIFNLSSHLIIGQDSCGTATDLGNITCNALESGSGDSSSTPDTEAIGFCLDGINSVWFEFTVDPSVPSFDISGTDMILFEGSCGSVNELADCPSSVHTEITDPSTTYYILVGENGDFVLETAPSPSNDMCGGAIDATGGITGENNVCSGDDDGMCGSQGESSVWYFYDLTNQVSSLNIVVNPGSMSDPAVGLYSDCGTMITEDCDGEITSDCLEAGTYYIQVSSEAVNQGTFDLSFTESMATTESDCTQAISISLSNTCVFETFSGDSSGACPETSDYGSGCGFMINETVWFEYSTSSNASSIDIDNLSSNLELSILDGPCGNDLSGCISSAASFSITGGATYYIAASLTSGGGSFDFDIRENETPPNNDCDSGTDIQSGADQTTCCANGGNSCGDAGVWFVYNFADGDVTTFDLTNVSISGDMGIEIYSGDCGGASLIFDDCGGGPFTFEAPNCGAGFVVHVTSAADECGDFSLTVTPQLPCTFAEDCGGGPVLAPSTSGPEECATSCTQVSCEGDCTSNGVWFTVNTDDLATAMEIIVNAPSDFDPIVSIYQSSCDNVVIGCNSVASGDITDFAVSGNVTYLIEVASAGVPAEFDLCVITTEGTAFCSETVLSSIEREEYPDEDENGPYCPGETVTFCFDIDFTVDPIGVGNNCQWLQGIVPTIGGGWDLDANEINGATDGPGGGWQWLDEGNVLFGPHSTFSHPIYEIITTANGDLGLEFGGGGLTAGDVLPGGWWFTSNGGGANCTNDGNPNSMWGVPESCGGSTQVEVCFDLTVRLLDDVGQCSDPDFVDLSVNLFTFADGQTGCWSNNTCALDQPAIFVGTMDCSSLIEVVAEDVEICNDATLDILVETEDGSPADIFITVIEEGNTSGAQDHIFSNGIGTINDQIKNEGSAPEVVIYEAFALLPPSVCQGPITEIQVLVYPEIEIEVEEPYFICFMQPTEIEPMVTGGGGGPYNYDWEDGSSDPTIELPLELDQAPGEYQISLVVTDNVLGCSETMVIDYEIIEPLFPEVIISADAACINQIADNVLVTLEHDDIGTGPYDYIWSSNPNGLEFDDGPDDNSVIIIDEDSRARTYTLLATVIDDFGCEYTAETVFTVDNGPDIIFEIDDCLGSELFLQGYTFGGDPVTYELFYSEDGDWDFSDNTINNADFLDSSFGESFEYITAISGQYILLGVSANGCADFAVLDVETIPSPVFEVLPSATVCAGQQVTINISNQSIYSDFEWSTGDDDAMITVSPTDSITYIIELVTDDDCTIIDSVRINVSPNPEVNISGSASFCPGTSTTLTVDGSPNFSYLWTGPAGEMITTQTAMISTAGVWEVMVISDLGCQNSDVITLSEDAQLTPQIVGDNICAGNMVTLDGGPGFDKYSWTDAGGGVVGTTQTIDVSNGGIYTLEVALGACLGVNDITIEEFNPLPNALSQLSGDVCNQNTGTLSTDINLNVFETGVAGTWFDENDFEIANPSNIDFTDVSPGVLSYSFVTTDAIAPCENDTYTFLINISDCACPDTRINTPPDLCVGDNSFDLTLIQETVEPGTWSVIPDTGIDIVNNNTLLTDDATESGSYTLTYTLDQAVDPGCDQSSSVNFVVFEKPTAELDMTADVCNADSGADPDFIDLDDLFVSGMTGEWSTNEPGLSIDGDNIVFFTGLDEGNYTFLYLLEDPSSPCDPVTIQVPVRVRDCSCPNLATTPITDQCNDGTTISLADFLDNPDNVDGSWTVDPASAQINIIGGNRFNINDVEPGVYTFTYTIDNFGPTCETTFTTELNLFAPPELDFTAMAFACNGTNVTVFPTELDLTELVSEPGVWTDPSGNVVADPTSVDFEGEAPGDYVYNFVTGSAIAPCTDVSVDITIEVVNCNCPPIVIVPVGALCNDGGAFDLNDLFGAPVEQGEWSFVSGPENIVITNNTIELESLEGTFLFQYTLDDAPMGCQGSSQIALTIVPAIDMEGSDVAFCEGESQLVMLEALVDGFVPGGVWTETSNSIAGAFDPASATFNTVDQRADLYSFEYQLAGNGSCDGEIVTAQVILNALPVADAGDDFNITCDTDEIVLGSNATSSGADFSYEWTEATGIVTQGNTNSTYTASQSGIYTLVVTDENSGCTSSDEVEVFSNTDVPSYLRDIIEPNCSDQGAIIVTSVNGGAGDYLYSIDGGMTFVNDPMFMDLPPGTYDLIIQDANGCETPPEQIIIVEPGEMDVFAETFELSDDEFNLQIATTADPDDIVNVAWTENGNEICNDDGTDCASIIVSPDGEAEYCVTVEDAFGCIAEDCVTLRNIVATDVYIANVFTPNGDTNNSFFVQTGDNVIQSVDEFRIYDRWGELVFNAPPHLPNNPEDGWDGSFDDKLVEQGVYVYVVKVTFEGVAQETEIFSGSVTVLR
ncbi:gliding motility-associated C-terminal domain-containing protein [Saprospiraceae bacterium]|nr:gliding motility-associated C-terminal domain-containing protein [Saprospiraceae bacterium]